MTYALIQLQSEEMMLQGILIDPILTESERSIIQQIIDYIRWQIEEIVFILS